MSLKDKLVFCPYCGQPNHIQIDLSAGNKQLYEEDCQVCCRPWKISVEIRPADRKYRVRLQKEDES